MTCILADVGLGKSTLLRLLQAEYGAREEVVIVALPTPEYKSNFALMRAVCSELGMPTKRSLHEQLTLFQTYLLDQHEAGKTVILFIDEAQKLRPEMLELCRTLLNFETYEAKLIQIVLAGQLELRDALLDKKNRAL